MKSGGTCYTAIEAVTNHITTKPNPEKIFSSYFDDN